MQPLPPTTSRPFLAAPRTAFYHPSGLIDAARGGIDRCVRRSEGFALVVGPAGTGKSLLLAKLAEDLGDDFDVALLTGARICTRRALWQSILAEIGEAYRGLEEGDLRMAVVERIRGLAATCSGLVLLVDEAHTLPLRLVEELRLLSNVPTPLPAVHVVLAGTSALEERLASPKMESFSQRIVERNYLEPLDHAETCDYVRAQCRLAGLAWEDRFAAGCDDAVFTITDGVPRLINQVCDHALLAASQSGTVLQPAGIQAAWREIQRLPSPESCGEVSGPEAVTAGELCGENDESEVGTISFGSLDDEHDWQEDGGLDIEATTLAPAPIAAVNADHELRIDGPHAELPEPPPQPPVDPWEGPDVEFVFDASHDPFEEIFEEEERVVQRYVARGPDDFRDRVHVSSREGAGIARQLEQLEAGPGDAVATEAEDWESVERDDQIDDDDDMIIVEEDILEDPREAGRTVFAVRPGDYRGLFARLRRG